MSVREPENSNHPPVNRKQEEFSSPDLVTVVWIPASVENPE